MDDEAKLRSFIRTELSNGRGGVQSFMRTYRKFGLKNELFSVNYVLICFNYLDNKIEEKVPSDFILAMRLVRQEFEKIKRTIPFRRCQCEDYKYCQLTPITDRYALDMKEQTQGCPPRLYIIDGLYGRRRDVRFNITFGYGNNDVRLPNKTFSCSTESYRVFNVDPQLIIIIRIGPDRSSFQLYLFSFDLKKLECTLLDHKRIEGTYDWIVADQNNPDKLLLKTTFPRQIIDENIYLHKLNIVDGKFNLLNSIIFEGNLRQNSLRYEGNKLAGIFLHEYSGTMRFMEWELLSDSVKQIKSFDIPLADSIDSNQVDKSNFIWIGNEFHMFTYMICDQVMLMKLDMDDQKMTLVAVLGLDVIKASKIVDDRDLVLWTLNRVTKQHVCRRVTVGEPQKVKYLAMERLRQNCSYFDDTQLTEFTQQLPPTLRPFGGV